MRRQDAGADARRAPAGRGPGWPESMRRQDADARRGARRARAQDGRASNPWRAAIPWRKAVGFSGTSIQALVFARSVRLNGGRARGLFVYVELHTLGNFSFFRGACQPQELIA